LGKNQAEGKYVGARNGIEESATDVMLKSMTSNDKIDNKTWIDDSVASWDYCKSNKVIYNYTIVKEETTAGNRRRMMANKKILKNLTSYLRP
jgi:hypothetical protein